MVETCDHILLWYLIAYSLWCMAFGILGYNWVLVGTIKDEIWAWKDIASWKKFLGFIPLVILWVVWNERDRRFFEGMKEWVLMELERDGSNFFVS